MKTYTRFQEIYLSILCILKAIISMYSPSKDLTYKIRFFNLLVSLYMLIIGFYFDSWLGAFFLGFFVMYHAKAFDDDFFFFLSCEDYKKKWVRLKIVNKKGVRSELLFPPKYGDDFYTVKRAPKGQRVSKRVIFKAWINRHNRDYLCQ